MCSANDVVFFHHRFVGPSLPLDHHPNAVTATRQMKRNLFTRDTTEFIGIAEYKRSGGLLLIGERGVACEQGDQNPMTDDSHCFHFRAEVLRNESLNSAIEDEWLGRMICDRDSYRRCNASLINLNSQNILRCKRTIVNPAMTITMQIQHGFG